MLCKRFQFFCQIVSDEVNYQHILPAYFASSFYQRYLLANNLKSKICKTRICSFLSLKKGPSGTIYLPSYLHYHYHYHYIIIYINLLIIIYLIFIFFINWIEIYLSLANFHTKQAVFLIKKALTKKKSLRLPLGLWLCLRKYGLYQYLSLDFTNEGMLKIFKFPRYKHLSRTF